MKGCCESSSERCSIGNKSRVQESIHGSHTLGGQKVSLMKCMLKKSLKPVYRFN